MDYCLFTRRENADKDEAANAKYNKVCDDLIAARAKIRELASDLSALAELKQELDAMRLLRELAPYAPEARTLLIELIKKNLEVKNA